MCNSSFLDALGQYVHCRSREIITETATALQFILLAKVV